MRALRKALLKSLSAIMFTVIYCFTIQDLQSSRTARKAKSAKIALFVKWTGSKGSVECPSHCSPKLMWNASKKCTFGTGSLLSRLDLFTSLMASRIPWLKLAILHELRKCCCSLNLPPFTSNIFSWKQSLLETTIIHLRFFFGELSFAHSSKRRTILVAES